MKKVNYIYKKNVDWSLLNYGFSIPLSVKKGFLGSVGFNLKRGQKTDIKVIIDGQIFSAKIVNQYFDQKKYPNHSDIIQVRFSSELVRLLREIFDYSYRLLKHSRETKPKPEGSSQLLTRNEYLVVYDTVKPDTFLFDFVSNKDSETEIGCLNSANELEYESELFPSLDKNADLIEKQVKTKIRRVDRRIAIRLKELYGFKCQICGSNFGERYGAKIVESHHIIPFVKSLNNNPENQIILCPNHHRILHNVEADFSRNNLAFTFRNGFVEKIRLNYHL
ncbi:HNH endonuclease [Sedimentisphaera salicampi]|uniref:HNH endonuclease n=1 Tax=Sedimentisphaera salicampi TaxID=1941349 RepID=UPI0013747DA4|nr:HNH endonuclease [Sedimentisphaera salicampi]